ncbi:MAG: hypothetical protein ACPGPS_05455, partial [Rubripirellula sp.]
VATNFIAATSRHSCDNLQIGSNGTRSEKRRTRQNADANRADILVGVLGAQKDHFMLPMSTRGR